MLKRLPNYFSIIAALLVIVIGLLSGKEAYDILLKLIYVIIIAFVFGHIVQFYLNKWVLPKQTDDEDSQEALDENESMKIAADADIADDDDFIS